MISDSFLFLKYVCIQKFRNFNYCGLRLSEAKICFVTDFQFKLKRSNFYLSFFYIQFILQY